MSVSQEIAQLHGEGYKVDVWDQPDGWLFLVFRDYPLPSGYNKSSSELLVKVPPPYPAAKLDMFWMDADLTLNSGGLPQSCNHEVVNGKVWLRFSWHPNGWDPRHDNLKTFLNFIRMRLLRRA